MRLVLFLGLILLTACSRPSVAQDDRTGHTDPEIQSLIERTYKNMIFVEGGSFMMGDPGDELVAAFGDDAFFYYLPCEDNRPAHQVRLDSYYLGRYEITYGEHDVFTVATGREPTMQWRIGEYWRAPEYPAGVNWQGAHDYCQWLGEQTGLPFALPTEAQWEYAARSRGQVVPFATDTGYIERGVNYPNTSKWPFPVGKFPPNPLGFHDMSGNAYEWVFDWYDPDYYSKSPEHNPQGPETGTEKVYRGGGVHNSPGGSSTVIRGHSEYYKEDLFSFGFRCAINTDQPLPVNKGR